MAVCIEELVIVPHETREVPHLEDCHQCLPVIEASHLPIGTPDSVFSDLVAKILNDILEEITLLGLQLQM